MNLLETPTGFKKADIKGVSGIYYIQCKINKKVYIGETIDLFERMSYHIRRLLTRKHDNEHLQNAINKYGISEFLFDIIDICPINELKIRENHWAHTLNVHSRERGYNILGTDIEKKHQFTDEMRERMSIAQREWKRSPQSEETKKKIGDGNRGKYVSEETRQKLSEINKGKIIPRERVERMIAKRTGQKSTMSPEARKRVSEASKNSPKKKGAENPKSRKVIQYDLFGKYIRTYDAIREFDSRDGHSSQISAVCKGSAKTAYGYIWRYYTEDYLLTIDVSNIKLRYLVKHLKNKQVI